MQMQDGHREQSHDGRQEQSGRTKDGGRYKMAVSFISFTFKTETFLTILHPIKILLFVHVVKECYQ